MTEHSRLGGFAGATSADDLADTGKELARCRLQPKRFEAPPTVWLVSPNPTAIYSGHFEPLRPAGERIIRRLEHDVSRRLSPKRSEVERARMTAQRAREALLAHRNEHGC